MRVEAGVALLLLPAAPWDCVQLCEWRLEWPCCYCLLPLGAVCSCESVGGGVVKSVGWRGGAGWKARLEGGGRLLGRQARLASVAHAGWQQQR